MTQETAETSREAIVELDKKRLVRVLLVDDEIGLLKIAKQCLEAEDTFQVDTASSIREAYEEIKKESYDTIVSDYQMPEKDGLQFLRELRQGGNKVPFIIFTGRGREEVAIAALNLGASQYLNKTGDPGTVYCELAHAIRHAVNTYKAEEKTKQSEDKLISEREKAEEYLRIVGSMVVALDSKGDITLLNKKGNEILGYAEGELLGRNWFDICLPEDNREETREVFEKCIQGQLEQAAHHENTVVTKDGERRIIGWNNTVLRDNDRRIIGTLSSGEDITERKRAEETLEESGTKYQSLVEQSLQGIVIAVGPEPRGVFANKAMTDIFGYASEDFYSFSPQQIGKMIHPEDREQFLRNFSNRLQGKEVPSRYEFRGVRKDGSVIWLEISSKAITYEGQRAVQAIFSDITERKRAEQKLQHFFAAVKASLDGIVTGDLNGNIEDVNEAALKMYGSAEKSDLIGGNVQNLLVERDRPRALQNAMEIIRTGQGKTVGYTALTKSGAEVPIDVTTELLRNERGEPTGFVDIIRDLTELKNQQRLVEESQKKFRALFMSNPEAAAFVDERYRVIDVNSGFTKLFGYTLEEIKGKDIRETLVPDELGLQSETAIRETVEKTVHSFDTVRKRKDGSCIRVSLSLGTVNVEDKLIGFIGVYTNIEETKAYEEKLQKSSEEWTRTFDSISDFVFILDPDFKLVKVNKATCDALKKEPKELIGKRCFEVMHHTKQPWPNCPCLKTFNTKTSATEEISDPNLGIPLLVTVSPISDAKGEFCGVVHIAKDIAIRKKQETLLLESQQKFRALFHGNPEASAFVDTDMHILDVNARFTGLFGYTLEEIKNRHINDVVVPENLLEEGRMLDRKAGDGYVYHDTLRRMKNGCLVPVSVSAAPIYVKSMLTGYVWLYKDISQQRTAEESLKESEERFRALFVGSPEAVVYLGSDFHIRDVNPRFEQLFGYSLAEVRGKHIDDVVVQKGRIEEATALNQNAVIGYVYHDTVRKRKNESLVPVSISAAPIVIKDRLVGIVGMYKDITDLKNAEQKTAMMNEKLRVVGGLTRHDVRNKLSIITGNTYLMKKKLKDRPDVMEGFEELDSACATIVQLLDFAKDYERLGVDDLDYVDVEDCVQKTTSLFHDRDGTKVLNECQGLSVLADSLLSKLFYNLIDNSLKHGGRVSRIMISHEQSEDQLDLIYEDDGVGMSPEAKPRLFTEGFTTGKGSGYGLFLIKKLMEVYGWTIQEIGTPETGTRFVMAVPKLNKQGKANYRISGGS